MYGVIVITLLFGSWKALTGMLMVDTDVAAEEDVEDDDDDDVDDGAAAAAVSEDAAVAKRDLERTVAEDAEDVVEEAATSC